LGQKIEKNIWGYLWLFFKIIFSQNFGVVFLTFKKLKGGKSLRVTGNAVYRR